MLLIFFFMDHHKSKRFILCQDLISEYIHDCGTEDAINALDRGSFPHLVLFNLYKDIKINKHPEYWNAKWCDLTSIIKEVPKLVPTKCVNTHNRK